MSKLIEKFFKNKSSIPDSQDIEIKIKEINPINKEGAIMFTDVKASSKLWSYKKGKEWNIKVLGWIETHFDIMQQLIIKFNKKEKSEGKIVKTVGDAAMIYCPWKLKTCIQFAKSIQKQIENLNKEILKQLDKEDIIGIYNSISGPKLDNTVFSIRIGFCYGSFNSLMTPIQHCKNFEDFFGPAVNLASRMESKVSDLPGTIAFTYYIPSESLEKISKIVEDTINNIEPDSTYIYYTFNTDTKFDNLDIPKLLHGALPVNTTLPIFVLLPYKYNKNDHDILKKGNVINNDNIIKKIDGKLEINLSEDEIQKLIKTYSGKLGIRLLNE